jgi:hypothetical protein
MLVPDYDAADSAPSTETIASSYQDCVEEVPWVEEFSCTLKPSSLHPGGIPKFLRFNNALPAGQDVKTYDSGNMYVCTTDGTAGALWGKLWVEYEVEFLIPQLSSNIIVNDAYFSTTPASTTNIFGTVSTTVNSFNVYNNVLTIYESGEYLLTFTMTGTGLTAVAPFYNSGTYVNVLTPVTIFNGCNSLGTQTTQGYIITTGTNVGPSSVAFSYIGAETTLTNLVTRITPYVLG